MLNYQRVPTWQVMTSPWEPMKPRLHRSRPPEPRRNPINDIRQDQQWQIGTKAFHHIRKQPACHWQIHWWCKKSGKWWNMMQRFKFQDGRNQDLTLTSHPNPSMGFHCQTCEHLGNGGAWGWNIFSHYFKLLFGCVQSHHFFRTLPGSCSSSILTVKSFTFGISLRFTLW